MTRAERAATWRRLLFFVGLVASLSLSRVFLNSSQELAVEHRLVSRRADASGPREYTLLANMLGGFRGLVVMALWLRAQDLKDKGEFYAMIDLYRVITRLQPSHAAAWSFQSWDLAYNVSVQFSHDPEDRVFWVFRGVDLLRKDGIQVHPEVAELYYQLGWIFHHKIGYQSDDAHADYKRHLKREVEQVLEGIAPGDFELYAEMDQLLERFPDKETLYADPAFASTAGKARERGLDLCADARALLTGSEDGPPLTEPQDRAAARAAGLWRIGGRLRSELAMEPGRMVALCRRFGPIDWSLAEAQALYWAWFAEEIRARDRPDQPEMRYLYLINHSLMRLVYTSDAVMTEQGQLFFLPDYRFLAPAIAFMEKRLEDGARRNAKREAAGEAPIPDDSVREGFGNFLLNMALNAFLDERAELAERLVAQHFAVNSKAERRGMAYDQFLAETLADRIETMDIDRLLALINIFYVRACKKLARGDRKTFERRERWVRMLHKTALEQTRKLKAEEGGVERARQAIPNLRDMKRAILVRIYLLKVRDFLDPGEIRRMFGFLSQIDRALCEQVLADVEHAKMNGEGR